MSPQIETILGFPPSDWMDDPNLWIDRLHPLDRNAVVGETRRLITEGLPFRMGYRVIHRDGHTVWLHDEATALARDDQGLVTQYQGVQVDITARKLAEIGVRESEARKAAILEAALDSIITIDEQGTVVEFNPAAERTLGFSQGQALGKPLVDLIIPPRYREDHRHGLALARQTGTGPILGRRVEMSALRSDGSEFPMELTVTRVGLPGRHLFTGYIRDITDRKRAEDDLRRSLDQLREIDHQRRRLLARLSTVQENERRLIASAIHDDTVQGIASLNIRLDMLIHRHPQLSEDEGLGKVRTAVADSLDRLRRLLFELHPSALDTDGISAALRQYFRQQTTLEGAPEYSLVGRFKTEPALEIRMVIYRIVQEASVNARKHARASRVEVTLEERDQGYLVRVEDDGSGFDAADAEERPVAGHLGLASMRQRAELAGGRWRIESSPRKGTRVEFWLPGDAPDLVPPSGV